MTSRATLALLPSTTSSPHRVYSPKDSLALTLNGTTKWPAAKALQRLGETQIGGSPAQIRAILERVGDAMWATAEEVRTYIRDHPAFAAIGNRMLRQWEEGAAHSLRTASP